MPFRTLAALLAAAALCGCATSDITVKIPIAGGERVALAFSHGVPVHSEDGEFAVEAARFDTDPATHQAIYSFAVRAKRGALKAVKVEDVTDDEAVLLVEDPHPASQSGKWGWKSAPFTPDRGREKWLFEIENSIRVYRFTLVSADGRSDVLYEAFPCPAQGKAFLRQSMGLDPPSPAT